MGLVIRRSSCLPLIALSAMGVSAGCGAPPCRLQEAAPVIKASAAANASVSPAALPARLFDEPLTWCKFRIMPRTLWDDQMLLHGQPGALDNVRTICVRSVRSDPAAVSLTASAAELRRLRDEAVQRGFADTGCHFYVDRAGGVWAARSLTLMPAAVPNHNANMVAIGVLGTSHSGGLTKLQSKKLAALVGELAEHFNVPASKICVPSDIADAATADAHIGSVLTSVRASRSP